MPKARNYEPDSAPMKVTAVFDDIRLQIGKQAWKLTPSQARQLSGHLNEAADHADGFGQDDEGEEDDQEEEG